ncbi:MAG: putative adenine-specific methylase [Prokaryotic dsDNA virus sp.]|jgi:site-specific DNA-methyltransferase (adenine-specific)|nr:MAG: putative adenine-specific methylase [Prokaryotic dsDNA virus sp.]|tara:strand:+ start:1111 stop:1521 length:411 start_codon:yes stop_codon:yes gene_type:complete
MSQTNEWETPQDLFNELDKKYHFTLDPCATEQNAKCKKFYTKRVNGLQQSWKGEVVFMNPPYGREIGRWMAKAYQEGLKEGTTIVCLIPSRTDTRYWHEYVMKGDITFIKGRLKFGDMKNSAPFPSAIVVLGGAAN